MRSSTTPTYSGQPSRVLYILAGHHQEAKYWAHRWFLKPNEWRYVLEERTLLGLRGFYYVVISTFWSRKDWREISERVRWSGGIYVENSVLDSGSWMS